MNIEALRDYCLAKAGVTEGFPFNEETLVFKVAGKMFLLTNVDTFDGINLKVEPRRGEELREQFPAVKKAYHMDKMHWMTVEMDGSIPDRTILGWVDDSYRLVAQGLTKRERLRLGL